MSIIIIYYETMKINILTCCLFTMITEKKYDIIAIIPIINWDMAIIRPIRAYRIIITLVFFSTNEDDQSSIAELIFIAIFFM